MENSPPPRWHLRVLRWVFPNECTLTTVGLNLSIFLKAVLLTMVTFFLCNLVFAFSISWAWRSARVPTVEGADKKERLEAAVAAVGGKEEILEVEFIQNSFRTSNQPAREQLKSMLLGVRGEEEDPGLEKLLDSHMTGQRRGLPGFRTKAIPPSGARFVQELSQQDIGWKRRLVQYENDEAIQAFIEKYFDLAATQVRPSLRRQMRYNGFIQWITLVALWAIILLVLQRWMMLRRLESKNWFAPIAANEVTTGWINRVRHVWRAATTKLALTAGQDEQDVEAKAADFAEAQDVKETLDHQVYGVLHHLAGLLPAFGFVGTVLGMSDALLRADSLFNAIDKTAALGDITGRLGFAFDTTLIGLVAGIIAGGLILALRLYEDSLWRSTGFSSEQTNEVEESPINESVEEDLSELWEDDSQENPL